MLFFPADKTIKKILNVLVELKSRPVKIPYFAFLCVMVSKLCKCISLNHKFKIVNANYFYMKKVPFSLSFCFSCDAGFLLRYYLHVNSNTI